MKVLGATRCQMRVEDKAVAESSMSIKSQSQGRSGLRKQGLRSVLSVFSYICVS